MARIPISTDQHPPPSAPIRRRSARRHALFLGQIPLDPATGQLVEGDITAQARRVFDNLRAVCTAAGGSFDDVVRVGIYLTDLGDFAAVNAVMAENFQRHFPRVRRSRCPACRAGPASKWTPSSRSTECLAARARPRMRRPSPAPVKAPLSSLPGVGPALAEKFATRGLLQVQDLWLHLPARYEDRTRLTKIADLQHGVRRRWRRAWTRSSVGFKWRPMLRVSLVEPPRHTLSLRFFHFNGAQAAPVRSRPAAARLCEPRSSGRGWEIVHPSYRFLSDEDEGALHEALDPVYPAIEGIGAQTVVRLVGEALKRLPPDEELELLPRALVEEHGLPSLREALLSAHRPARRLRRGGFRRRPASRAGSGWRWRNCWRST
jgi:ATP-dependent DNA helicase RecG